jgi:hypothetical protein
MSEKVEYFGNKDIMIYLLVCFALGLTIGVSFAHYKNVRFSLIHARMEKIKANHAKLELGYKGITDTSKTKIYDEVQELKGRSFDTGCTIADGEFRFNVTYNKPPKLIFANNGILVNSTTTLGKWSQNFQHSLTKEKITIKEIKPSAQEIHICWLAFPDLEEKKKEEEEKKVL